MDDLLTPSVQIVAGLLILFLGRRLFWLFVGVVGFYFGLHFGKELFAGLAAWLVVLLSVVLGVVCGALTIALQRLAVIIAGAFAGGMLAYHLAPTFNLDRDPWILILAGALLVAVLFGVLFDPALILTSALTGALMVVDVMPYDVVVKLFCFCVLFIVGVAVQMRLPSRDRQSLAPG
jgi:hypothetical protein